jgi:transcriptional regulator with XRE-family HTH domain
MAELTVDLDELSTRLRSKMQEQQLSIRAAAKEIGIGAATLGRLLQGSDSKNVPDLSNLDKAAVWIGRSLSQLASSDQSPQSTIADVEVHLRALPDLDPRDVDFLVAIVKAGYEAKRLRTRSQSPATETTSV